MDDVLFFVMLCLIGFGAVTACVVWIVTSNGRAANRVADRIEKISDLLTFRKA